MSTEAVTPSFYADFGALEGLKAGARGHQREAIEKAARQFESLLTRMMLKSMREASQGEGLGDSQETDFYRDMFDQQLSLQLSQGKGLGLASKLIEQLMRSEAASAPALVAANSANAGDSQRQQFVRELMPAASDAAKRLGVAPEAVIAQAALETGWGAHLPADGRGGSMNLFGIKDNNGAGSTGARALTTEFIAGQPVRMEQNFRRYDSLRSGVEDYVRLLSENRRYEAALNTGNDIKAFASGLQRAGYATDPLYADKLVATAASVRELLNAPTLKKSVAMPIATEGLAT